MNTMFYLRNFRFQHRVVVDDIRRDSDRFGSFTLRLVPLLYPGQGLGQCLLTLLAGLLVMS
jgi:hypothetical protein